MQSDAVLSDGKWGGLGLSGQPLNVYPRFPLSSWVIQCRAGGVWRLWEEDSSGPHGDTCIMLHGVVVMTVASLHNESLEDQVHSNCQIPRKLESTILPDVYKAQG
jgi:hypothetical protein